MKLGHKRLNKGDTYHGRVTGKEGVFTAELIRHNTAVQEEYATGQGYARRTSPERCIWGQTGFSTEEQAWAAIEREAFLSAIPLKKDAKVKN